ncbi:hypothetical protein P691DRAFT_805967 [Macrolepiota fuliginosa MF-IS2]|uniref:Uncharacterized protein n=1 Tax=Macrolepiota fuliginosa MF-IS2 TaxID=1400762 RepID=A0A9P5X8D8_9AGAR|nr:hypothetical protein P691DRAFT_805967 [Macrolepiota fuliginosa MF-IS2]
MSLGPIGLQERTMNTFITSITPWIALSRAKFWRRCPYLDIRASFPNGLFLSRQEKRVRHGSQRRQGRRRGNESERSRGRLLMCVLGPGECPSKGSCQVGEYIQVPHDTVSVVGWFRDNSIYSSSLCEDFLTHAYISLILTGAITTPSGILGFQL